MAIKVSIFLWISFSERIDCSFLKDESLSDAIERIQKEVFKNHPRIKEIKGSYKFIKPAKTQKDKSLNKKIITRELCADFFMITVKTISYLNTKTQWNN